MANTPFTFTLVCREQKHSMAFEFDLSLFSHQILHSFLSKGRLFEMGTSMVLCLTLGPGDMFIDIGAHVGYFTLLASRLVGPMGQVLAFEPEQRNYEWLLKHLRMNGITNVLPFHWACGAGAGVSELSVCPVNDGGNSLRDLASEQQYVEHRNTMKKQPVFVTPLDQVMMGKSGPGTVKAIKIDVEGFETQVLQGAMNVLTNARVPIVICENNPNALRQARTSEDEMRGFMARLGYETYADSHTDTQLHRLEPGEYHRSQYIFNFVFMRPEVSGKVVAAMEKVGLEWAAKAA